MKFPAALFCIVIVMTVYGFDYMDNPDSLNISVAPAGASYSLVDVGGGRKAIKVNLPIQNPGWPQVNITLPSGGPAPADVYTLQLKIKLVTPQSPPSFGFTAGFFPAGKWISRYYTNELSTGSITSHRFWPVAGADKSLASIQLAVKNPPAASEFWIYNIEKLKKTLADGIGFENTSIYDANDTGGTWSVWGGATQAVSSEWGYQSSKSMKLYYPGSENGDIGATLWPNITDWNGYKQLRFTIYNSLPNPNVKTRILTINNQYLPTGCSISNGTLTVQPESATTFILDLDSLGSQINKNNISRINFYKGSAETTFYVDKMKLYTDDEVEDENTILATAQINDAISALNAAIPLASNMYLSSVNAKKTELTNLLNSGNYTLGDALTDTTTAAKELVLLANAAIKDPNRTTTTPLVLLGVTPTEKVFRDTDFNGTAGTYQMAAAGREFESFQLVVLPQQDLTNVAVATSSLTCGGNSIPVANIKINTVGYIELAQSFYYASSRTGFWPDILLSNRPLDLVKRLQPYWITVQVPPNQPSGIYAGDITVSANGISSKSYHYEVKVFNFTLPLRGKCKTFFDFRYYPSDQTIRRACYELMLNHRLNPTGMYTNGNAPANPAEYRYSPDPGDLQFCLDRGMNMVCLWYLYNGADPITNHQYPFDAAYYAKFVNFITYYRPTLQAVSNGGVSAWDLAIVNGFDEIMHQITAEKDWRITQACNICGWIKSDYPTAPKISNVGSKMDISTNLMDIWYMGILPATSFADITGSGKTPCFYSVYGDPSPMLDLPGMAARILAWQAFREGAQGIGYYSTYRPSTMLMPGKSWPTDVDWAKEDVNASTCQLPYNNDGAPNPLFRPGRNGDGNLLYPDPSGSGYVLSSIRLENLRDGIEDFEYLSILKQLDPYNSLLTIPQTVVTTNTGDYTKDYSVIENHRRAVAAEIERLQQ